MCVGALCCAFDPWQHLGFDVQFFITRTTLNLKTRQHPRVQESKTQTPTLARQPHQVSETMAVNHIRGNTGRCRPHQRRFQSCVHDKLDWPHATRLPTNLKSMSRTNPHYNTLHEKPTGNSIQLKGGDRRHV